MVSFVLQRAPYVSFSHSSILFPNLLLHRTFSQNFEGVTKFGFPKGSGRRSLPKKYLEQHNVLVSEGKICVLSIHEDQMKPLYVKDCDAFLLLLKDSGLN